MHGKKESWHKTSECMQNGDYFWFCIDRENGRILKRYFFGEGMSTENQKQIEILCTDE